MTDRDYRKPSRRPLWLGWLVLAGLLTLAGVLTGSARAARQAPRDGNISCARTDNQYCKIPDR